MMDIHCKLFDYYQEGYKIYQSHNRINGVVSSVDKLWVGTESGLTCFDLNTHRYIPYYIKREDKSYQPDVFVSGLCFNPSNRHLWIRSDYGLSVAEVNSDSLYFLEWENEQTWNLCKYINNLQIRGGVCMESGWLTNHMPGDWQWENLCAG